MLKEKIHIEDLLKFKLFKHVEKQHLSEFLPLLNNKTFYPGEYILTRHTQNEYIYLLAQGSAEVYLNNDDKSLNIINMGSSIGEISALDGKSASAHVIALTECQTIVIHQKNIWPLTKKSHTFSNNILQHLIHRLREFNNQVDNSIQIQHKMAKEANIDALTGLYNRRWFDDNFDKILQRCIKNNKPFSYLMIDIDHFKQVNDNYGHAAGDIVLHQMGSILQEHARNRDPAIRYGGEELVIILPNTPKDKALAIAERLRIKVAESTFTYQKKKSLKITISIGCSSYTGSETMKELMSLADTALYQAKNNGRNQVIASQ